MELADAAESRVESGSELRVDGPGAADSLSHPMGEGRGEGSSSQLSTQDTLNYVPRTLTTDLARHRRLPPAECIRIGLALTDALAHLHRHGLVHRDIKPANIIFVDGVPKLADIGLVAEAGEARSYVGTEGFIPPEGPGTPQADLYSLGKLLYEISTGQDRHAFPALPADLFSGSESIPLRSSRREEAHFKLGTRSAERGIDQSLLTSPATNPGEPPNLAEQSELNQLVELNAILLKACQPDPRERYSSAEAMHAELALLQRGQSVRRRRTVQGRLVLAKKFSLAAAALFLLAAGVWLLASRLDSSTVERSNGAPAMNSVAVLPLVNESKYPPHEYLCAALTDEIITALTNCAGLRVASRESVSALRRTTNDLRQTGAQLGVRAVLAGRFLRNSNETHLKANLVNAGDGAEFWSATFEGKREELGAMGSGLAGQAAQALGLVLPTAAASALETNLQRKLEAYQFLSAGSKRLEHSATSKSNFTEAVNLFQQALSADSSCIPAHLGLGQAYKRYSSWHLAPREAMPTSRNHLLRVLELDPGSARARTMLGVIRLHFEYDLAAAEKELRRAVEIERSPQNLSGLLCYLWAGGRWEEAEAVATENHRRLPDDAWPVSELAGTYYFQRRYDDVLNLVRWMVEQNPNNVWAQIWAWKAHVGRGEFAEALAALARIKALDAAPVEIAAEGYVYGRMGRYEEARRVLAELDQLSAQRFVSKDCWAMVYAGLDDRQQAVNFLEQAFDQRLDSMIHLNINPIWDSLRDEPGFISLVQRLGVGK